MWKVDIFMFIHSFINYVQNTYHMSGTTLGEGVKQRKEAKKKNH